MSPGNLGIFPGCVKLTINHATISIRPTVINIFLIYGIQQCLLINLGDDFIQLIILNLSDYYLLSFFGHKVFEEIKDVSFSIIPKLTCIKKMKNIYCNFYNKYEVGQQ